MKNIKKILGAIIAHDKKEKILKEVISSALKVSGLDTVELFVFDTEKKCIEIGKEVDLKVNTYPRPEIDKTKISCSYTNILTGMWEGELMHLSWLRNEMSDYALKNDYDYMFAIDADILMPPDSVERLLKIDADFSSGWHFHKRLPTNASGWFNKMNNKEFELFVKEKKVVDAKNGTMGGILMNRKVLKNIRCELYNGIVSEDKAFFRKMKELGYKVKLDLGLFYEHLGDDFTKKAKQFMDEKKKLWQL